LRSRAVKETPAGAKDCPVCGYKEALEITGLKKTKLYDLFSCGVLRGYRDGAMIRFYRESLLAYMKARENAPAPQPPIPKPRRRTVKRQPGSRLKFL
jgi:excisionase family DNA binding protein